MIAKMLIIKGHNIWLTSGDDSRRKAAVDYIAKELRQARSGRRDRVHFGHMVKPMSILR